MTRRQSQCMNLQHLSQVTHWLLLTICGVAFSTVFAKAATCPISSGASDASVAATVSACGSGNTAVFEAGTYELSSAIYVPCGVSLTGPVVAWSNPSHNTATINSAFGGGSAFSFSGCSTPASVTYLNFNGGQPSPDGGQILYFPAGASKMTVSDNHFYGNQGNADNPQFLDSLVYFDGNAGSAVSADDTVTWNIFGGPGTNDCSNLMSNYSYSGLSGNGGFCNGLGLHSGFENLVVENNIFQNEEQGLKVYENQGECINCTIEYNDFNNIHRINFETQANIGGGQPTSMLIRYNSIHDQYDTNYGSWGFSAANGCNSGCVTNTDYNVLINNVQASSAGQYTPGAVEIWGSNGTTDNYNLVQGYWANGLMTSSTGQFAENNNTFCMSNGGSTTAPGSGGYFNDENENPQQFTPTATGNTFSSSPTCAQTSAVPTISPTSGSFTGSQTVTFTTSGSNRDSNTGIWYTTDGTAPVPGRGSAKYISSGGRIEVKSTTTVRAVGMWGAANQPTAYPVGYGYVPSPAVSAVYTGGITSEPGSPSTGTAESTLVSVVLRPTYGGATMTKGSTMQMEAHVTYADGSSGTLPDKYGNAVTWWNTTNHKVAVISSRGHATAVAAGSINLEAMVGALRATPWSVTVINDVEPDGQ
jgi:Chitobiase/beta-hexosaminidase C-terminal domain/Bacterial Ig-like domain (group 2)